MIIRKSDELKDIKGGSTTISGTVMNGLVDLINLLYEAGKSAGSSIRRIVDRNLCPLD